MPRILMLTVMGRRWLSLCECSLVAVGLFALAGCGQVVWTKDSFTQQDFSRDTYECERDTRQSGYFGGGLAGSLNMHAFQDRCMEARGWRKVAN